MGDARLQALWRERVHQAELKYTEASAHAAKVQQEYAREPHTPDGAYALQQALQVENETRQEYMRVLHLLTRLLAAGEIPEGE